MFFSDYKLMLQANKKKTAIKTQLYIQDHPELSAFLTPLYYNSGLKSLLHWFVMWKQAYYDLQIAEGFGLLYMNN